MSFEEFAALVGPPAEPPIPVDWDAVESWLGLKLPSDYKAVASRLRPGGHRGVSRTGRLSSGGTDWVSARR